MNQAGLIVSVLVWIATCGGSFYFGMDYKEAKVAEIKQAIEETRKSAQLGAADAISKVIVRNTTIQGKVETIIRDNPVYRDCKHDDSGMRLINEAITGKPGRTDSSSLPRTDTVN